MSQDLLNPENAIDTKTTDCDKNFEIEAILDIKRDGRKKLCLVKWKGYDSDHNTWEPVGNIDKAILKKYELSKVNTLTG
jgi:hypothetical protein